ncbi:VIR protein [Plasmodium vivax]|uniref:VIR protein n=1 Tax=Plasmodium vivax TaxID=5855 RepID=A0A1G4E7H5_PLAVI|nr:VIR protein [Plasmodium vivax]
MPQNKTVDSEVDDMALTFDEYDKLIEKFGKVKTFSSETVKLNDILQEAEITEDIKTKYLSAFKLLLKHIHDDGLFYRGNNQEACKYINYILYKEVQHEIKRSYDKDLIKIFHKFLEAYGKKRSMQNRCISNIYSIEDQTYNKINGLYEVYDKYKKCYLFKKDTVHYGCTLFDDFFASYDKYMRETQSKSLEFNKILENIEKHAKNAVLLYRLGCNNYRTDPRSPKLFKPDPVPKPETHNEVQMRQTRLQSEESTSHSGTHGRTNNAQSPLLKDISISETEQQNERRDEGDSANDIHSETLDHRANFVHITNDIHRERSLYSRHHGHEEEQPFSNEVEMSPPSVMSTITGVFRSVEPAPILGVSGGMGALFLLFKYTPVGTFFGGRRRRNHLIHSGFPGAYPGFAGFEEHYDANFGPGPINISYQAE